jgi:hypothetical protein
MDFYVEKPQNLLFIFEKGLKSRVGYNGTGMVGHRELEQMEPKVVLLTHSEGGKLVILLHNST